MNPRLAAIAICALSVLIVLTRVSVDDVDSALVATVTSVASAPSQHGLFVHGEGERWYPPLAVYPAALLGAAGVPLPFALVVPTVIVAAALVCMTMAFAQRLQQSREQWLAPLAGGLLLASPGFLENVRRADTGLLLALFLVGWCVAVSAYVQRPRTLTLVLGAGALAGAAYSHPAGMLSAAILFGAAAILLRRGGHGWQPLSVAAATVITLLMPAGWWVARHLDAYPDTLGRWVIHAAHVRNPVEGLMAFGRWHVMARRVSDYWDYFSPTFVFGSGELLALWSLALVAVGAWSLAARAATIEARVLLGLCLGAPAAVVLLDVARDATSVLSLVAAGALLGAMGLSSLRHSGVWLRAAVSALTIALVVAQLTRLTK
jgi:hypothetical protein